MGDPNMGAAKLIKSKWETTEGWARRTMVGLIGLLVIGACSYIVSEAINSPSASEVNAMIKTQIEGSPLMTRGAQGAFNQLVLDNSVDHVAFKKDLEMIQGSVIIIQDDVKEIKDVLYDIKRAQ